MAGQVVDLVPIKQESAAVATAAESVFMPVMSMEVALARRNTIVEFTKKIMVPDQDFGTIPGTNKPSLLKPGAEKLCCFFGLEPEFIPIVEEADWTGDQHKNEPFYYVRYRCRLLRDGRVLGVGEGSCNSWESKYRWRQANRKCPQCGGEFIIAGKAEYGGGWLCFKKKGGCGAKFETGDPAIANQQVGRVPNPDIADVVNTIQKMAQKRALVAATLIATSASEFFTQDTEDMGPHEPIDTGGHPVGTQAAQDYVRDKKLAEAQPEKPQAAQPHRDHRTIPEELLLVFERIDKDSAAIAPAFQAMENWMRDKGGANGILEYQHTLMDFRKQFPKGSETRADLKNCLLDLWEKLQTVQKPEETPGASSAGTSREIPPTTPGQQVPETVQKFWARMGSRREAMIDVFAELLQNLQEVAGTEKGREEFERIEIQYAGKKGGALERVAFARRVVLEMWKRIEAYRTQPNPDVDDSDIPDNIGTGKQGQLIEMPKEPMYAD